MNKSVGHVLVILVTTANKEEAVRIGKEMVDAKLAACANIILGVQSIYRWKGKVERAKEFLLIIKTTERRLKQLEREIARLHSYEVPEIIAVRAELVSESYFVWMKECLK